MSLAIYQAREDHVDGFIFGNLAVMATLSRDCRPMALRPCFSTGLLFRISIDPIIATGHRFALFILVI